MSTLIGLRHKDSSVPYHRGVKDRDTRPALPSRRWQNDTSIGESPHQMGRVGTRSGEAMHVPQGCSQLIVEWPALGGEPLLQDAIGSTHPGVMGLPLPLGQLGLQQFKNLRILGVGSQVPGLVGVLAPVVQLPTLPVVVMVEILIPAGGAAGHSAVQEVLEGGRHVEVLVDGKGHLEIEVVHEAEGLVVHGAHGVGHGDLVVTLAAKDGAPEGLCLQHRQEGPAREPDSL